MFNHSKTALDIIKKPKNKHSEEFELLLENLKIPKKNIIRKDFEISNSDNKFSITCSLFQKIKKNTEKNTDKNKEKNTDENKEENSNKIKEENSNKKENTNKNINTNKNKIKNIDKNKKKNNDKNKIKNTDKNKKKQKSVIIYLHSIKGNKLEGIPLLNFFLPDQAILLVDFCGLGNSEGEFITYGIKEKMDLEKICKILVKKFFFKSIFFWGRDLGAITAVNYVFSLEREFWKLQEEIGENFWKVKEEDVDEFKRNIVDSCVGGFENADLKEDNLKENLKEENLKNKNLKLENLKKENNNNLEKYNKNNLENNLIKKKEKYSLSKKQIENVIIYESIKGLILDNPYPNTKNFIINQLTKKSNKNKTFLKLGFFNIEKKIKKLTKVEIFKNNDISEKIKNIKKPAIFMMSEKNEFIDQKKFMKLFNKCESNLKKMRIVMNSKHDDLRTNEDLQFCVKFVKRIFNGFYSENLWHEDKMEGFLEKFGVFKKENNAFLVKEKNEDFHQNGDFNKNQDFNKNGNFVKSGIYNFENKDYKGFGINENLNVNDISENVKIRNLNEITNENLQNKMNFERRNKIVNNNLFNEKTQLNSNVFKKNNQNTIFKKNHNLEKKESLNLKNLNKKSENMVNLNYSQISTKSEKRSNENFTNFENTEKLFFSEINFETKKNLTEDLSTKNLLKNRLLSEDTIYNKKEKNIKNYLKKRNPNLIDFSSDDVESENSAIEEINNKENENKFNLNSNIEMGKNDKIENKINLNLNSKTEEKIEIENEIKVNNKNNDKFEKKENKEKFELSENLEKFDKLNIIKKHDNNIEIIKKPEYKIHYNDNKIQKIDNSDLKKGIFEKKRFLKGEFEFIYSKEEFKSFSGDYYSLLIKNLLMK